MLYFSVFCAILLAVFGLGLGLGVPDEPVDLLDGELDGERRLPPFFAFGFFFGGTTPTAFPSLSTSLPAWRSAVKSQK